MKEYAIGLSPKEQALSENVEEGANQTEMCRVLLEIHSARLETLNIKTDIVPSTVRHSPFSI